MYLLQFTPNMIYYFALITCLRRWRSILFFQLRLKENDNHRTCQQICRCPPVFTLDPRLLLNFLSMLSHQKTCWNHYFRPSFAIWIDNISLNYMFASNSSSYILDVPIDIFYHWFYIMSTRNLRRLFLLLRRILTNLDQSPFFQLVQKLFRGYFLNRSILSRRLLHPHQSGFRKGHSCQTALPKVSKILDEDEVVVVFVLINFSKAFHYMDHDILIEKLKN